MVVLEVGPRDGSSADGLERILNEEVTGILVRGVYSPNAMGAVAERLGAPEVESVRPHADATELHVGQLLQWAGSERTAYHASARRFEATCERLFAGFPAYGPTIEAVLGRFSGGRPLTLATSSQGEPHIRSTIRLIHEGSFLPLHFDNQQLPFSGYDDLRPRLDTTALMSFFIPIALPLGGGDLALYSRRWTPVDNDFETPDQATRLAFDARAAARELVLPGVGDMLVFDAGRTLHEVTPVRGARPRYTIGGFVAFKKDRASLLYWA